jgi:hypothetical protein
MPVWIEHLIALLALPQYSLGTVFVVSFISATLVPLGSEPVVFGLIQLNPELFWPVVWVATAGNTLGGAVDWVWCAPRSRQIPPLIHPHPGAGLAGKAGAQSLPAGLAAGRGRPTVRGGRMVEAAILAVRCLYGPG